MCAVNFRQLFFGYFLSFWLLFECLINWFVLIESNVCFWPFPFKIDHDFEIYWKLWHWYWPRTFTIRIRSWLYDYSHLLSQPEIPKFVWVLLTNLRQPNYFPWSTGKVHNLIYWKRNRLYWLYWSWLISFGHEALAVVFCCRDMFWFVRFYLGLTVQDLSVCLRVTTCWITWYYF